MGNKPHKTCYAFVVLALLFLFAGNALSAQEKGPEEGAATEGILAGKTVWVVDINTNEYYKSNLQLAIVDHLPRYAPGVIVRHVITAEKGNPFFLLKQEDYPDAVIISLAVCDATAKNVANYASEARKKGIPSVMIYLAEARDLLSKWNKAYRNPEESAIEIETISQNQQEAIPIAKRLAPICVEKLKH
jgi:hypothetical protein